MWNLTVRDWDPTLLTLFGIPEATLPRCVPTRHAFGTLALDGRTIPLTIVTGDQSAALFAYGEPRPGSAYINLGTGAFVQRALGHHPGHHPWLLTGVVREDGAELTCAGRHGQRRQRRTRLIGGNRSRYRVAATRMALVGIQRRCF